MKINDIYVGDSSNILIYIGEGIYDYSAMQGPAPTGFHVPSKDEWAALCGILTTTFRLASTGATMKTYLKMPMSGWRNPSSANEEYKDSVGIYWSTNESNNIRAYSLSFNSSSLIPQSGCYISTGLPLRCFKDSPVIPDSLWTVLYDGSAIIQGAGIFHNATLGLISISGDGSTWYTIQDKNLGATTVYNDGDTLSESNCGYYYQWGNNYGFSWTGSITTSSTPVDTTGYGPGNYYSSSIFIVSDNNWSSVQNDNLRGGVTGVQQKDNVAAVYRGTKQIYGEEFPEDMLCFTANTANSTIQLTKIGTPTVVNLEVSRNGFSWSDYTIGDTITLANIGDNVYMRNKSTVDTGFSTDTTSYYHFVMSGSIASNGDIGYLLNKNSTDTVGVACFYSLFNGCTSLTSSPSLPAVNVAAVCYAEMFSGCTSLATLPALPATALDDDCYVIMFNGCTGIKISTTQTGEYQTPYRIPITGTGIIMTGTETDSMFINTGGTFTGTPSVNTTYYTSNTVV